MAGAVCAMRRAFVEKSDAASLSMEDLDAAVRSCAVEIHDLRMKMGDYQSQADDIAIRAERNTKTLTDAITRFSEAVDRLLAHSATPKQRLSAWRWLRWNRTRAPQPTKSEADWYWS